MENPWCVLKGDRPSQAVSFKDILNHIYSSNLVLVKKIVLGVVLSRMLLEINLYAAPTYPTHKTVKTVSLYHSKGARGLSV